MIFLLQNEPLIFPSMSYYSSMKYHVSIDMYPILSSHSCQSRAPAHLGPCCLSQLICRTRRVAPVFSSHYSLCSIVRCCGAQHHKLQAANLQTLKSVSLLGEYLVLTKQPAPSLIISAWSQRWCPAQCSTAVTAAIILIIC